MTGKTDTKAKVKLSDNEGAMLGLILRNQPISAYRVAKMFEQSPVASFNSSRGQVYPAIQRLEADGLVKSADAGTEKRQTKKWSCTDAGIAALETWMFEIETAHLVLADPMRTKVLSFGILENEQRLEWIAQSKAALREKLADIEEYGTKVDVPFQMFVHDSVVSTLRTRIDWLDRMHFFFSRGGVEDGIAAKKE